MRMLGALYNAYGLRNASKLSECPVNESHSRWQQSSRLNYDKW